MKWNCWTIVAAVALIAASTSQAQQPTLSGGQRVTAPQARRPIFSQISWWAKYGQPLEAPAVDPAAADAVAEPIVMHDGGHGFGYVYGPGACDCRPPCTDHLWAGYVQSPWRCSHPQYHQRYRGFCGGCGACGHVSDCGCTASSCTAATNDCGCQDACGCTSFKPFKQWLAHWRCGQACCDTCDSCSAPIGCADPAPHADSVPQAAPATLTPPAPLPAADEASILKRPAYRRVSVLPSGGY